ncbi:MAG: hypothetical protein Q8Q20_02235 [bacterium]|nr:hypothetical protein [bacterium]
MRAIIIIIIILVLAAGVWAMFFRDDSETENTNVANVAETEDPGNDSVIDTANIADVEIESDLDDVKYYADEFAPPQTVLDIEFK